MISNKKIITLTAVLAVLAAAVLLISFWPFGASDETTDKISVFEVEKDSITQIDVYLGYENFSFVKKGESWVLADDEDKKLKQSAVDELAFELAALKAEQQLENPGEDSEYGLDRPAAMINLSYGEEAKMFVIGDKTQIGDMYYFNIMNEENVYTMSAEKINTLTKNLAEYRDKTILGMTADEIKEVRVKNGSEQITFAKKNDEWSITNPVGVKADGKKIEESVISPLSYLTVLEFIAGDDYVGHGVAAEDKVVYVEDTEGNSERIIIGNRRDNGDYYIKTDSSPEIYKVEGSSLEFSELGLFDFTDNSIFGIDIEDLASASIKAGDKTYVLSAQDGVYKINDIEILKDEFTGMYANLSSLAAEAYYTEAVQGNAEITIDYSLNSGESGKLEFVSIDEASYAVKADGKCEYKIAKEKVSKVITSVNSLIEK